MTDLSDTPPRDSLGERSSGIDWPTPPLEGFPASAPVAELEACELEGATGSTMRARLVAFDPDKRTLVLQAPQAKKAIPVNFDTFRRLTLLAPLDPDDEAIDSEGKLLKFHPQMYRLLLAGGAVVERLTLGHREHEAGHFLYEPFDGMGAVRRVFVPRKMVRQLAFGDEAVLELAPDDAAALKHDEADKSQALSDDATRALSESLVNSIEELEIALARQARMPMVRLGDALIALGLIKEKQLREAVAAQRENRGVPLGEVLVRRGVITREQMQMALIRKMGYPVVDLATFPIDPSALVRVNRAVAARATAMPLMVRDGKLVVAVEDPTRTQAFEALEFAVGCKLVPVLTKPGSVKAAMLESYGRLGNAENEARNVVPELDAAFGSGDAHAAGELLAEIEDEYDDLITSDEDQVEQSDNTLVRLVNSILLEAQLQGVSDVHIECRPGRQKVMVRFRKDGVLKKFLELPHTHRNALLARLKIMCDLDISERRKPQDGKIPLGKFVNGSRLELRVVTIPTNNGLEDAVLRLLASAKQIPLDNIGMLPRVLDRVKNVVSRPYGMFLCVGPTGSGKTTTLHSALGYINTPDRKIWTAEDPVEITQEGLRQVQVNAKIGWTFERALRSFLRADPDVIMIGEIRDQETAQMAVESSLTGHMVMSTLHTNSAPETVTRLLDMGLDPFNFSDSLLGVLAQRLVRRLCSYCRTAREATDAELIEMADDYLSSFGDAFKPSRDVLLGDWATRFSLKDPKARDDEKGSYIPFYSAPGCDYCQKTGLRGRVGLHEMLAVSRSMRRRIQTRASVEEMQKLALNEGMRTLRQDGIEKVLMGLTTMEEVRSTSNE